MLKEVTPGSCPSSNTPDANPSGANYREYFAQLCRELPPLPDEDPEARAAREERDGCRRASTPTTPPRPVSPSPHAPG